MNLEIYTIEDKKVCLGGVGKLFYEKGFPISMSAKELSKQDITLSWLHVADECLKHGWSAKTTYNKIQADISDSGERQFDINLLKEFCYSEYEEQREMLFKYLFTNEETASKWLASKL